MIKRRKNRVNSTLSWDGQKALLDSAHHSMRQLYAESRTELPRNSVLSCGGEHGAWVHCPNRIADRAIEILAEAK